MPTLRAGAPAAERGTPIARSRGSALAGRAVPRLPRQERYAATAGDDAAQPGQAVGAVVAKRGDSMGAIPDADWPLRLR